MRRAGVMSDGGARLGIVPDRMGVAAGVLERVLPDQPFVDHDAILEAVDPTGVAVYGGSNAPLGIAPELRLNYLGATLGLRLIHDIILNPGDQGVQQAFGLSGRARNQDMGVGGP